MQELLQLILSTLLFLVNALVFLVACSVVLVTCYRRFRAKGYAPPATVGFMAAACALGIGMAALANHDHLRASVVLFLVEVLWLPLLFSAIGMAILILVVPRRKTRVFGERRIAYPLIWGGRAFVGAGLVLTVCAVVLWLQGTQNVWSILAALAFTLFFLGPTARFMTRLGRKAKSVPVLAEVLAQDPRPPVLYLRAFVQESQFFVIGSKSEYGAYAKSWHAGVANDGQAIGLTFEEYLGDAFYEQIGPFIALGGPEDYVSPEGAVRTYADDANWKDLFLRFAREASCIVAEVGKSSNLHWEFTEIRQEGLQQKLFIFTRLSRRGYQHQWAFWSLLWRLKGLHLVNWQEFSKESAQLGYEIDSRDPGPGSILTFDSEGRSVLIKTDARRPLDFVGAITLAIANQRGAGPSQGAAG